MGEGAPGELRYKAFLSYSHKDAAAAARLHRRLEGYRLPKRLAGRATGLGPVPQRLWPIFRDREEMAASSDLSETVRAALSQSATLVVLCSAHAAASLWVNEEIRTFRALHPERPVLAAVLDGDPPQCFPDALRARDPDGTWHEPLATDLRRQGDGPRLGLLKLVAGITGVALDDLVQRDATRRIRRVTAVTAAALAAMLVMAALTLFALDSRREAERQRAEAEGLIEFMLTDLRDRLKGVGRLDVLAVVNERALRYYEARGNLSDLPDESLARRARIFHAMGDDYLERHEFDAALVAFLQAHQTTSEQLARAPGDLRRIYDHAKSDLGVGRVYEERGEWRTAQSFFSAFAAAADRLAAFEPNNADYLMRAGSAAVDLGNVQLNGIGDYQAAQRSYERAVAQFRRAARVRPGDLHVLFAQANAYAYLGDSFFVRSLWSESLDARLRQYAILQSLHRAAPNNAEVTYRLAAAQRGLGNTYYRMGNRGQARTHLFQGYRAAALLVERDPQNAEWAALEESLSDDVATMDLGLTAAEAAFHVQRERARDGRSH